VKGMPSRPKGMRMAAAKPPQSVKPGFGTKHQLRKGTMFPGMDTTESGLSDEMTDYARMAAAGGSVQ